MSAFEEIFARVKPMFEAHADGAVVKSDDVDRYYLDTHEVREKDGYRTAFGGAEVKKNYVSVHLTPVYVRPELLDDISPELRKKMQGKSCFNFKKPDDALLGELEKLIDAGAADFREKGLLRDQ